MSSQEPSEDTNGEESEQIEGWRPTARGPEKLDLVNEYLADKEDWPAKTVLDVGDPRRLAALTQFHRLFPSCSHQQPILDEFLETWMKARTSRGVKTEGGAIQGQSRKDFKEILMALWGQTSDKDNQSKVWSALAADLYDDDD